MKHAVDFALQN